MYIVDMRKKLVELAHSHSHSHGLHTCTVSVLCVQYQFQLLMGQVGLHIEKLTERISFGGIFLKSSSRFKQIPSREPASISSDYRNSFDLVTLVFRFL